jgi:hypothetical protein
LKHVLHPAELELYRIDQDPYEVNNLASHPEHAATVARLHKQLKVLMKDAGETLDVPAQQGGRKEKKDRKNKNPGRKKGAR